MKKYFPVLLGLSLFFSTVCTSCFEDKKRPWFIDHVGDKSPLAKANQLLASLEQVQRAEFGKLIGTARAEINQAFEKKNIELSALRDSQALLTEKVDVTFFSKVYSQKVPL